MGKRGGCAPTPKSRAWWPHMGSDSPLLSDDCAVVPPDPGLMCRRLILLSRRMHRVFCNSQMLQHREQQPKRPSLSWHWRYALGSLPARPCYTRNKGLLISRTASNESPLQGYRLHVAHVARETFLSPTIHMP